jgi:carbon storage regulator
VLISRRKEGDSLQIGDEVEIRIVSVRKNKVTLGVVAPRDMKIVTRKLNEMEMANTMAAAHSVDIGQLLRSPLDPSEDIVFVLESDLLRKNPELTDMRSERPDE